MAKEWYVKFKRQIRGFDPYDDSERPNHTAVGRAIKHLDLLANAQRWPALSSFLSEDPDAALDLLDDDEEDVEATIKKLGKLRWFEAKEALTTVDNLIMAIEQLPRRLPLARKNTERVVEELKDLQRILKRAAEKKIAVRFYSEFG